MAIDPSAPPLRFGLKDLLIWAAVSGYLCGLIVLGRTSEIGPWILDSGASQMSLPVAQLLFYLGHFVAPLWCFFLIISIVQMQGPKSLVLTHVSFNLVGFLVPWMQAPFPLPWIQGLDGENIPLIFTLSLGIPLLLPAAAIQHWYARGLISLPVIRLYAEALLLNLLLIGYFKVILGVALRA